jgi:hypothetical protein
MQYINKKLSQCYSIKKIRSCVHRLVVTCFALSVAACNGGSSNDTQVVVKSGTLVIMPLLVKKIESGNTTTATVSLLSSQGIESSNPITVSVWSNESAIMSVTPQNCSLYTSTNSCSITLTGESAGTATFSIKANGYSESSSENLIITPPAATVHMSSVLPYSTTHAGIQTPVMILFSRAIDPSSVTNSSFYIESTGGRLTGSITVGSDRESATFTPLSQMDYGLTYTIHATSNITDSSGNPIAPFTTDNTFTTQAESYLIFLASNRQNGSMGGITGADNVCNTDIAHCNSPSRTCKAMLVDDAGTRVAAPTPINWVLAPYTAYQNIDGVILGDYQLIGITGITSNGVTPLNSSVFGFNLQHHINDKGFAAWTGMNVNWTTSTGATCSNWTSSSGSGIVGASGLINYEAISSASDLCSNMNNLYCVQQP